MKGNKENRKTKEQLQKERKLNDSMVSLAKKNQEQLDIVSVQPEKNIISLNNGKFVKVYSLKGVELTDNRKRILIMELCRMSNCRMRISTYSYASSSTPLIFLSVFFEGSCYAEVAEKIDEFDVALVSLMNAKFKLQFSNCSIGDVFMFIYMNFNGQMRKVSSKAVVKKSANLKKNYFQEIQEHEQGYRIDKAGKVGKSFLCIQYPEEIKVSLNLLRGIGCTYLSCIDFQVIEKDFTIYYNKMINDFYNSVNNNEQDNMLINLSFMLTCIYDDAEQMKTCENVFHDFFEAGGLIAVPCIGTEKKVFESIATFGLMDFHCCRNANFDIVSKLFG